MSMTFKDFKETYNKNRPSEPYFPNEKPEEWFDIVQYAEQNLEEAFKCGFERAQEIILHRIQCKCTDLEKIEYDDEFI